MDSLPDDAGAGPAGDAWLTHDDRISTRTRQLATWSALPEPNAGDDRPVARLTRLTHEPGRFPRTGYAAAPPSVSPCTGCTGPRPGGSGTSESAR